MTISLDSLITRLENENLGRQAFRVLVEDLIALSDDGEGLLALKAVIKAKVDFANKNVAVRHLIRATEAVFPSERRSEFIHSLSQGWGDLDTDELLELLGALFQLVGCKGWDLTSIRMQIAELADDDSKPEIYLRARNIVSAIRRAT